MNKKKQIGMAILAMLMTASVTAWAANDPLTISADTLSYDGNTGIADANGNVVITQADKTMTVPMDGIIQKLRKQILMAAYL